MDTRRTQRGWIASASCALLALAASRDAGAQPSHAGVAGGEIAGVEVQEGAGEWRASPWSDLAKAQRAPGLYRVRFAAPADARAVEVPVCAGRGRILRDGAPVAVAGPGPAIVAVANGGTITIEVNVGKYERRIACGAPPRAGAARPTREGLGLLKFASPLEARGGGKAVVYVPATRDAKAPLLVGLHPWDGGIWTYAAYAELLREAEARGVVLLMPSGLGNSLYTADAEDEVMRAIDAALREVPIDPARVSVWGASMGGAGATTIAFHRPDRFAGVTSFFGDAKYDLATYVRSILRDEAGAHAVNALDVADNARHLDVWLVHGEDDRVSPIAQSAILAKALEARGFTMKFDRVPGAGHEGALVARFAKDVVARAATTRIPSRPPRVSFASVRAGDTQAYGVRVARSGGDAFVDLEGKATGVRVHAAKRVREIVLAPGALGIDCGVTTSFTFDDGVAPVPVRCEPPRVGGP